MVKQAGRAKGTRVSASATQNFRVSRGVARAGRQSVRAALLPPQTMPVIAHAQAGSAGNLDAVLAIVPDKATAAAFDPLPESGRWRELHARSGARSGSVRTTVFANRRQTLAVIGYIGSDASAFQRLALAGRMLKECSARTPQTIGLFVSPILAAAPAALEALLAAALAQAFQMPAFRASERGGNRIQRVVLLDAARKPRADGKDARVDVPFAVAAARGNNLVRWLGALPPNILDARGYHRAVATLARRHGLGFKWLNESALRRAGANAFLAVSSGNSRRDAGIAHLTYRPPRNRTRTPDVALVGKGIVFDTGGVNLKTHRSMLDMHTDMSGSAVALATLLALAELRAPIAADAWLAITENHIGPDAYRPQEIVTASNGVTIQVIHTDAEGRMVLADTLALAARTRPRFMIDFATLTGACVYSLTERMSGVLTNRAELAGKLVGAGRTSGERVWHFPSDADFDSDLESKIADILQCSADGKGDHILATRFLGRFVPDSIAWAHVDLSSATRSGGLAHINTDVTGFGVRYALELILRHDILKGLKR